MELSAPTELCRFMRPISVSKLRVEVYTRKPIPIRPSCWESLELWPRCSRVGTRRAQISLSWACLKCWTKGPPRKAKKPSRKWDKLPFLMKYLPIAREALHFELWKCCQGRFSLLCFLLFLDPFHLGILNVLFLSFGAHNLLGVKKYMTCITRIYGYSLCTALKGELPRSARMQQLFRSLQTLNTQWDRKRRRRRRIFVQVFI